MPTREATKDTAAAQVKTWLVASKLEPANYDLPAIIDALHDVYGHYNVDVMRVRDVNGAVIRF